MITILTEELKCPVCESEHYDVDEWALRPHTTHLCLNCGKLFEGSVKAVSKPKFVNLKSPGNVQYVVHEEFK